MGKRSLPVILALVAAVTLGCAGGAPLMTPAHTLSRGTTRFAGGMSANFAVGEASNALANARAAPLPAAADKPSPQYVKGAMVAAAIAPGVAPFAMARVGLGYDAEAGLAYTGRTARIDARYAFQGRKFALSAGIGGNAILGHREGTTSPQLDHLVLDGMSGWGLDVPLVFGWRSDADVVWWWLGVRGGYESLRGSVIYETPGAATGDPGLALNGDVDGRRVWGSALMGAAVGFRHVHAGIEVQGTYHDARGKLWGTDVSVQGFSLVPAAALLGTF
jgi:hypothetical protein